MTDLANINLDAPTAQDLRMIDAAVAWSIFGILVVWENGYPRQADSDEGHGTTESIPYYTDDNNLTFAIVREMQLKGWYLEFNSIAGGYRASFGIIPGEWRPELPYHGSFSPAIAVCVAALKAEGVLK